MKELHSEIEIAASPERVWDILADFAAYPRWNPFIRHISGELEVGERLEVRLVHLQSRFWSMSCSAAYELAERSRKLFRQCSQCVSIHCPEGLLIMH